MPTSAPEESAIPTRGSLVSWFTATLLILCYSLVPIVIGVFGGMAAREAGKEFGTLLLGVVFVGTTIIAIVLGYRDSAKSLNITHWRKLCVITLAGFLAAGYFFNILITSAAVADWLGKALLPAMVAGIGLALGGKRSSVYSAVGIGIGCFGYAIITKGVIDLEGEAVGFATIALSFAGATGSAVSIMAMGSLAKDGVSRFHAIAVRYGIVGVVTLAVGIAAVPGGLFSTQLITIFCLAGATGGALVNATLYLGLAVLNRSGATTLSICLLIIPLVTTLWQVVLSNMFKIYSPPHVGGSLFWTGALVVLLASIIAVLGETRAGRTHRQGDRPE